MSQPSYRQTFINPDPAERRCRAKNRANHEPGWEWVVIHDPSDKFAVYAVVDIRTAKEMGVSYRGFS